MHFKITDVIDTTEQWLSLDVIRDHLRVYDPHDDVLLSEYLSAAVDFAETYMNRAINSKTVQATFSYQPRVYLPLGDVESIMSVSARKNNQTITIPSAHYHVNFVSSEMMIDAIYQDCSDFVVEYKVGYKNIPSSVKLGILKLIATWYENREDVSNGVSVQAVPFNHLSCFNLHRIPVGGQ